MVYSSFPLSLSQKEIAESLQNNITKGKPFYFIYFIILPHTMNYKQNNNDNK